EEIMAEVDGPILTRHLAEVQRRNFEHLAGALAVAAGDDRRLDVEEPLLLEEIVDRPADTIPNAGHGAKRVGPGPEVGERPQELKGVTLLLQRIGLGVSTAMHREASRRNLGGLPGSRRGTDLAGHRDAGADGEFLHLVLVVG